MVDVRILRCRRAAGQGVCSSPCPAAARGRGGRGHGPGPVHMRTRTRAQGPRLGVTPGHVGSGGVVGAAGGLCSLVSGSGTNSVRAINGIRLGGIASSGTVAWCDELTGDLFPHLSELLVKRVFFECGMIRMVARTQEAEAPCPGCAVVSNRVHSTNGRSLADTPVGDRPVRIEPTVRRLYCENVRCSRDAVVQGLTTCWNSGPVEGRVNHIKMIKRQMFGRAKLPLLRKRVLLTAAQGNRRHQA